MAIPQLELSYLVWSVKASSKWEWGFFMIHFCFFHPIINLFMSVYCLSASFWCLGHLGLLERLQQELQGRSTRSSEEDEELQQPGGWSLQRRGHPDQGL